MVNLPSTKQVMINFDYMSVERKKRSADSTAYDINTVVDVLSKMFSALMQKSYLERKHDFQSKEKTIWLDSYEDLGNGNINLIFKSAKYNQSRNVRNTETMEERGIVKAPEDGDEEKTHLCIRLGINQDRFITVHELNYYGITINEIEWYLNQQLEAYQTDTGDNCVYAVSFEIVLSKDFLTELKKMKKINMLTITIDKSDPSLGDFWNFSGRNAIRDNVEVRIHKKRGLDIPFDLIENYFNETGVGKRIKKIAVDGSNLSGSLKIDTNSIQLRHSITVGVTIPTNEVDSAQFFTQAQGVITQMGG